MTGPGAGTRWQVAACTPAVLVLAALLTATACAHPARGHAPAASSATPHRPVAAGRAPCGRTGAQARLPDPATLDRRDPTAVSCAALVLVWTLDTRTDSEDQTQHAGELRAAASTYLTPAYAAQLRDQQPIPNPLWPTWTRHHAYLDVRLTLAPLAQVPPDTLARAYREWKITTIPTGRDDWHGPPIEHVAFVTLSRDDDSQPWQVAGIGY